MSRSITPVKSTAELDDLLSQPPEYLVQAMSRISGDLIVLGVAGKMGPTLARMAVRASELAGVKRKVYGVARFSDPTQREKLESWGIETITADLLEDGALESLPDAENVIYMAVLKFGSTGNESLAWAMNTYVPSQVAKRYRNSKIVAFSTGNIYDMVPTYSGGSIETDTPKPVGEYAITSLGRERMFDYFSRTLNIPTSLIRLNYACELRYGVLVDLARKVWEEQPIDLTMGAFNIIWQADANAMTLASLERCSSPPFVMNVAGPETLSVRRVCEQMACQMQKKLTFTGSESNSALLSNGQKGHQLFGYPSVSARELIEQVTAWVMQGGESLGKPTKFEVTDGKF